ncbi:MAG: ABC transporter permease [Anaerolineales bacterium]|jgi:peptide/nickel transport system permease protein
MATNKKEFPTPEEELAPWEQDLGQVGILRSALRARKWYGADWWFVAISMVMVAVFLIIAFFPAPFAPYGPNEIVGSSFLAPGETPPVPVLIIPQDSMVETLEDLAVPADSDRPSIAVEQGLPTSTALREQAQAIDDLLKDNPEGLRLRPRIERFNLLEDTLQAVVDGEVQAAVVQSTDFKVVSSQFPTLRQAESIMGDTATAGNFLLGTNDIGQDVFSRLIWGAQVALLIGFSSSIVALVLGVPLGLIAAFVGGALDRYLSLLMDSLYAFPGLILAIAITAILGPSVFNIIVAIAVVYIPTYYRIVRGQTFSVKEEIYVEAARSIGARRLEILRRYIFPNVIPSVAIIFSVNVADAILTGAGLSFLGLGLPPTIADWGIDLARGQRFIQTAWWLITFPGFAIMLVVLAFTLMGEGLMEIFNPKLRER